MYIFTPQIYIFYKKKQKNEPLRINIFKKLIKKVDKMKLFPFFIRFFDKKHYLCSHKCK